MGILASGYSIQMKVKKITRSPEGGNNHPSNSGQGGNGSPRYSDCPLGGRKDSIGLDKTRL